MDTYLRNTLLNAASANDLSQAKTIQPLWGGYGSIDRYRLTGSKYASIIVKHVRLPLQNQHPRGWNTDLSHQRKLRSYQVESAWYQQYASRCDDACRVPECLALEQREHEFLMVLEDLDSSGYAIRRTNASQHDMQLCLHWLANFHALFLQQEPDQLWETGTYWHLETRPDELAEMEDGALKQAAPLLDQTLKTTPFQTLVHGDAKLANFCFSNDGKQVAGVDFQYIGGGCGMKDVAYFIGSCLDEHDCERLESALLATYFAALQDALAKYQPQVDAQAVEAAWRPMYSVAWTDFYRFLQGWSPIHWKIHGYSERLAEEVVNKLLHSQT